MTEKTDNKKPVQGHVKWFDPAKGFGFIISDDGGPDILLHANVLRNFGQSSVADRARIEVHVQQTERGMQATEVLKIEPPADDELAQEGGDFVIPGVEVDMSAPLEPARVKWFDKAKGFGFANVFGRPEDVFLHIKVLRRSGLADLQPGEAVGLRSVQVERGRMACYVAAWDAAIEEKKEN